MSVKLEVGGRYRASRVRWGTSEEYGKWELIAVYGKNHRQCITVFPTNIPSGVKEDTYFQLDEIVNVEVRKQRDQKTGLWKDDKTSITAFVSPCLDIGGGTDDFGIKVGEDLL